MLEGKQAIELELLKLPRGIVCTLLARLRLTTSDSQAVVFSAGLFLAITWVPLLLLCLEQGTAFQGLVKLPLCADYINSARFLIVAPLLILSDLVTKPWLLKVANHTLVEHIGSNGVAAYNKVTKQIFQLRDAASVQLVLFFIAVATAPLWVHVVLSVELTNWQVVPDPYQPVLSGAGKWHAFISQPLFRFVILDWFWDYALWAFFLFKISRFPLRISATHPDGVGGLGFIAVGQSFFGIAAFALSTAMCSVVAQTIVETHATLQSFTNLGILFLFAILLLFLGPLLVFTPILVSTKRQGIFTYGALCHQLNDAFAAKWITAKEPESSLLISSQEPSTLADLNASFQNIQNMRIFVFGKPSLIAFVVAACLPALPLVATAIPLKELLEQLIKALT